MDSAAFHDLSNPQKRIWLTELTNNNLEMSNIGYLIQLKGHYDLPDLARAVKYVVNANPALRMRFKTQGQDKSQLQQYLPDDDEEVTVDILNVQSEDELFEKADRMHRKTFDINGKYFCSFVVFSIAQKTFGLMERAHHLVADGISATIVAREAIEIYHQLQSGNNTPPPVKEFTYFDFLKAEQNYIGSDKYNRDRDYWLGRFDDFEGDDISFAFNKNKKNSLKVKRLSQSIPQHLVPILEKFKTDGRLSNFALFMAALGIYFYRFFNHDDIVIGMPVHNRAGKQFKQMVGMFVSTLPFRIRFEQNRTFNDLVNYIKKELWESLKHQGYPYNHLVKDLKDRDIDSAGLLNVQLIELPGAGHDEIDKRAFFSTSHNISQLSVYLNQQNSRDTEELDVAIDYHSDLFDDRDVEHVFKRLMVILEQGIKEPDRPLAQLPLLEDTEHREMIFDLNRTGADVPEDKTLPALFREQAARTPDNIALEYEGTTVTYGDLDRLTDTLAAQLQNEGVKAGAIVGMMCERSIEAVLCILGIQKAGGAYLPIDPEYPADRINYIIDNSGIDILLVEKILENRENPSFGESGKIKTIHVDYRALEADTGGATCHDPGITGDSPAYVIYTSGTTGNPKGTVLRHRNVVNYVWWGAGFYVAGQNVDFPLFTSLSFDLTVTSIFIPLVTGNRIVIYRDSSDGLLVEKVVRDNKVDIIKLTPSHLKVVNQLKFEHSRVKQFILGGEELTTETAREALDRFGHHVKIHNEYGPTETAVGCMIHTFDRNRDTDRAVPVGKASANVRIYILDGNRMPMPSGVVGEIYIAGKGVAQGYLNNRELTESKFLDDPFVPGEKMYRSGDLGRRTMDAVLEFHGRADEQVKIRGYRIEPGEIENRLLKHEDIKSVVVAVHKNPQPELRAYLVAREGSDPEVPRLREWLSMELPAYMLPAEFVRVEDIPLTRNGKVDMRKLQKMGTRLEFTHEYTAPRTEMETMLADIWAGVLNSDRIGVTDNFFELGGDSIKAVQIAARLNDAGKTVNVKDILTHQTIANLCAHVDFDSHIRKYDQAIISGEKPPSPIEGWFLSRDFADPNYYHQSAFLEFKQPVDAELLENVLSRLVAHHDGLRLNYNRDNKCFYFNNDLLDRPFGLEVEDLSGQSESDRAARIGAKGLEVKGGFDICDGPMVRAVLFKGGDAPDGLLLVLHHLVTDGLTWRILLDDLYTLYRDPARVDAGEMPQKTASLMDWYDGLVMYRDSGKLDREKDYWHAAETADFRLPYDRRPEAGEWGMENRALVNARLEREDTAYLLKEAHESYKTDVQILVTAALVRTLRAWTGKRDVVIEMENHGRHIEDLDTSKTAGWFTAIYPLLVNREDESIGDEIKSVKEAIRKVPDHGIGYGILKYMTDNADSTVKRTEIRFNYLGQFDREVENDLFSYTGGGSGSDVAPVNHMTTAIEINAMILNEELTAEIGYNNIAFSAESMETFSRDYIENLKAILSHIRQEDDVHFTPSDFDTVDLSEDDLAALFQ